MTDDADGAAPVRLRLDVRYDGSDFSGWAVQPGRRTVQETLERALATVLRVPPPRLTVAGRTDAGVHARGQVAHADVDARVVGADAGDLDRVTGRLARLLPDDVRVRRVSVAPDGFDARFSAVWRRYAYRICDSPAGADPLARRYVLAWPRRLDEEAMARAATSLAGEHDFAAFCRRRVGATTVRALRRLDARREGDDITFGVVADAFCHNMVRALIGCLVVVGEGKRPEAWPAAVLGGRQRDPRVRVLPPRGLTLEEVGYPPDCELAARAHQARRLRLPTP
ncbi:MAG: tRNA pseudouridine38-40 synthase [Nocardioidaceae bacterium]|nr:tRNA pseudouridine38-40 synthase [Nocardioidaceae bacterium]